MVVDHAMVGSTQQEKVGQACGAALGPRDEVVSVGPAGWAVAAGEAAAAISGAESPAHGGRDGAGGPPDVERLGIGAQEYAGQRGVAGDAA